MKKNLWKLGLILLVMCIASCQISRRSENHQNQYVRAVEGDGFDSGAEDSDSDRPIVQDLKPISRSHVPRKKFLGSVPISLDWPVDEARLTRGFFYADPTDKKKKRPHLGLDLANRKGTPILSSHAGRVIYAGLSFKGFGRMVMLEDLSGHYATLYAHLHKISVKVGQLLDNGELIGLMGRSGRSFGVHLHFELRTLTGPIDPLPYLPEVTVPRGGLDNQDRDKNTKKNLWVGRSFALTEDQSPESETEITEGEENRVF